MDKVITQNTPVSKEVIRDSLKTQKILRELKVVDKDIVDLIDYDLVQYANEIKELQSREESLINDLNIMWDGKKYNKSHQRS